MLSRSPGCSTRLFELLKGLVKNWWASDTSLKDNAMEASDATNSFVRNHAGVSDQVRGRLGGFLGDLALGLKPMLDVPVVRPALALPDGAGAQSDSVFDVLGHDHLRSVQLDLGYDAWLRPEVENGGR